MKIQIRTADFSMAMPLPAGMAGFILKRLPEKVFENMRAKIPQPYCALVTKEIIGMLVDQCLDVVKESKGLEVLHLEGADGTFVSIKL